MVKRYILRKDGIRQRYNIVPQKGKSIKQTLIERGYTYSKSRKALQFGFPDKEEFKKFSKDLKKITNEQIKQIQQKKEQQKLQKLQHNRDIEEKIRDSIFHAIPKINRKLSNLLPVAYDKENDIWVVNDYHSTKSGHSIPIEIKIRYNSDIDEYEVQHYQFRNNNQNQSDLESWLND